MTTPPDTRGLESESNVHADSLQQRDFRLLMMYHPSHHVADLREAEEFFESVFGCTSTSLASMMAKAPPSDGYPTDYSTFTPIRDVLFDTIDPKRYILAGVQRYATVTTPHLKGFGWYVENMTGLYRALRSNGFEVVSQLDVVAEGEDPPTASGSKMPLCFTVPSTAGLRYEFMPKIAFPLDHRIAADWTLPDVSPDDPLGIDRCSHHTVLTGDLERACRLFVEVLGGVVIDSGRNELLGAMCTYVSLADATFEFALPDPGTSAHADWSENAPNDTYHSITWVVNDLVKAERHLRDNGVAIASRSNDTIITDPTTSLGIPWAFTSAHRKNDPRWTR